MEQAVSSSSSAAQRGWLLAANSCTMPREGYDPLLILLVIQSQPHVVCRTDVVLYNVTKYV